MMTTLCRQLFSSPPTLNDKLYINTAHDSNTHMSLYQWFPTLVGPQGHPCSACLDVSLLQHTCFRSMGHYPALQKPVYDHSFESGVVLRTRVEDHCPIPFCGWCSIFDVVSFLSTDQDRGGGEPGPCRDPETDGHSVPEAGRSLQLPLHTQACEFLKDQSWF